MKVKVILLILTLIMLSAYNFPKKEVTINLKKQNRNYEIKEVKEGSNIKYDYIIYDDNHNEMDRGTTTRINPHITNIDKILQLCISEGTSLQNCKYYDTEEKRNQNGLKHLFYSIINLLLD